MNLALQTRRAVISLSFVALAMACIAAKTATRNDAAFSAEVPARVESIAREALDVSSAPVLVTFTAPIKIVVKSGTGARCDGKAIRI